MIDMEAFDKQMDAWAAAENAEAQKAKAGGNERAHSIALMRKSMYETMLRTLGCKAPGKLDAVAADLVKRAESLKKAGDEDAAERCDLQRECVLKVRALLMGDEEI